MDTRIVQRSEPGRKRETPVQFLTEGGGSATGSGGAGAGELGRRESCAQNRK